MARRSSFKMHKRRHVLKRQVQSADPNDPANSLTAPGIGTDTSLSSTSSHSTSSSTVTSQQPKTTAQQQQTTSSSNSATQSSVDTDTVDTDTSDSSTSSTTTSSSSSSSSSSSTSFSTSSLPTSILSTGTRTTGIIMSSPTLNTRSLAHSATQTASGASSSETAASGGLSTGSIVGIAAGGLVGFGVLIMIGLFIMKRIFKRREDDFDRNSFIRQSANLEEVEEDYSRPRPPTMIERHTGVAGIGAHGYSNFAPPVPTMDHLYAPDPFMTPVTEFPPVPPAQNPYEQQGHPYSRAVSPPHLQAEQYGSMAQPVEGAHQTGYANMERSSVTPYQEAQYAEISRQLSLSSAAPKADSHITRVGSTPPTVPDLGRPISPMSPGPFGNAHLVTIPEHVHASKEANVQYGYHEPGQLRVANPSPKRPGTMYDEEDAYGGI